MDFSGSGSTAHAVLLQNSMDGGSRKFIQVQIPETLDEVALNSKVAAKFCKDLGYPLFVSEITKERIRRASAKILEGDCHPDWNRDVGFRVLKIDSSNMADVYYTPDATKQADLLARVCDMLRLPHCAAASPLSARCDPADAPGPKPTVDLFQVNYRSAKLRFMKGGPSRRTGNKIMTKSGTLDNPRDFLKK